MIKTGGAYLVFSCQDLVRGRHLNSLSTLTHPQYKLLASEVYETSVLPVEPDNILSDNNEAPSN